MDNLTDIILEKIKEVRPGPQVERERAQAIDDLLRDNHFIPCDDDLKGPWSLALCLSETHIQMDLIKDEIKVKEYLLPRASFRDIIKDYFIITDSYAKAIQLNNIQHIESIDMGRRATHNEGAHILQDQLVNQVELDLDTARRLFTLICVLYIRRS